MNFSGPDENKTTCPWCKGHFDEMDLQRARVDMAKRTMDDIVVEVKEVKALMESVNDAFAVIEEKLRRLNNMAFKLDAFVKSKLKEEGRKL